MLRIGLTGAIASGKSTAASVLAELGAVVVDADVLAREVVAPGSEGLAAVRERFGDPVLREDGSLDRRALGRIVFSDAAARRDLEAIVHPRVRALAARREAAAGPDARVVHVIPLLVETGQQDDFDVVVVVDVDPQTQLRRLQQRDGLSGEEARARVAAQADRETRLGAADVVWSNDGDPERLREQIVSWWQQPLPN
ncbi:dephospho-CoA kinase [Auraticoccus sp. F435]|uniref:Dephospho-CoA kinase n=1 Tax=Auraticoccus cholistanensis TaxID=2656650 RepID=A0A6A9V1E4_9ACTN|nr:dephospho-CoA kinase [Auraticoccus cholistanensis]MVA77259.1 dephospho-CoA kinase [Auraticoccus cholistanensis]